MTYTQKIKAIKKIAYSKYANVSSREKLIAYTIKYLNDNGIPANFNNICVAAFKLFPEKFYFSEEFRNYPHIEMLNRTILHLRPKERNYAQGSVRTNYRLTKIGHLVAEQVTMDIAAGGQIAKKTSAKPMDRHKKTDFNDLYKVKKSDLYKMWLKNGKLDTLDVWRFFGATPFTQHDRIRQEIKHWKSNAEFEDEKETIDFLSQLEEVMVN